jgi:pimeloyl-ACP methyl ester carboxylesterase
MPQSGMVESPYAVTMRADWVDAGNARLYVRRWGEAGGTPFLFLHSLGPAASAAFMGLGVGPIVEAGYAVAAPDMPGFGGSPPVAAERYEVARLAEMTWEVADALAWEWLVLAGHSWGGSVAVHAAAASPERVEALVLLDSGHIDYADQEGADLTASLDQLAEESEAARLRAADRAEVARELKVAADDPLVDAFFEGLTDDGQGGLISRTLGTSRGAAMYHLMRARQSEQWPVIAAAGIPTLLLLATEPAALRAQNERAAARFRDALPEADIRFLEGVTHSLVTDMREDFGRLVAGWLRAGASD